MRVPAHYLVFLGKYAEHYRQFKYHEYISNKSILAKRTHLTIRLLDRNPVKPDLLLTYMKNLMNNKFLFFRIYT